MVVCALNVPLDAVQVTPEVPTSFATVAVKFKDCPSVNPPALGVTVTPVPPLRTVVTVMVADAVFVVSVTEVAVNVTVGGTGMLAGAVYVTATPEALEAGATVPHVAPLQPTPERDHVTPLPAVSLATVAVNACAAPARTLAVASDRVTPTGADAAATVMVAAVVLVASATEVAVNVTVAGLGTLAGAVYVTATPEALLLAESAPHVAALQPAPDSAHVTPLFPASLVTVAMNV